MSRSKRRAEEELKPHDSKGHIRPLKSALFGSSMEDQVTSPEPDRLATCHRHVTSLNAQFLSWVQLQHSQHRDELWTEGVRDYLTHAQKIMLDFKDVVEWLKASSTNQGPPRDQRPDPGLPPLVKEIEPPGVHRAQVTASEPTLEEQPSKKRAPAAPPVAALSASAWAGLTAVSSSSGAGKSSNAGMFGGQQSAPFVSSGGGANGAIGFGQRLFPSPFGTGSDPAFAPIKTFGAADAAPGPPDENEEEEPSQPESPSLKREEEPGVEILYEKKAKLYMQGDDKSWKDMGVGLLHIKKYPPKESSETEGSSTRIMFRTEIGRLLMNATLFKGLKTSVNKKRVILTLFSLHNESSAEIESESKGDNSSERTPVKTMYCVMTGSEQVAEELSSKILEFIPE